MGEMMGALGTRTSSRQPNGTPATRTLSRDFQRGDPGSTNHLSASLTFTAATARIAGANGTFTSFALGDRFQIEGSVTNDGGFQVSSIDAANHAYVTVAPAPKDQGAVTAFVRKIAA
jgi:hypothetical protein